MSGKAAEFRRWVDKAFEPPEADYVLAICQECDREVWKSTGLQPFGMAESCEQHWPLSEFVSPDGGGRV